MTLDRLSSHASRSIDAVIDSDQSIDAVKLWSWPVMKALEQVLIGACNPLAATLFETFHANEVVFSYVGQKDGGSWVEVSHSGDGILKALPAYASRLCVDTGNALGRELTALSVRVSPKCGFITTATTPNADAGDARIVVESFYRTFVLRHLSFMCGTPPPVGQGLVLTYGLGRMRIEHVHAPEHMACGPVAECLWIDEIQKSQRITLD